jgi:glyoxylase-like metal-dependent hydrolase (beta-lactamase superfamily II)
VEPLVDVVVAPNPGPFTLEGTNTWIVGRAPAVVIDPGPDDASHLRAVAERSGEITAILLTHHHPDHGPGATGLGRMSGAPILAASPRDGEQALAEGTIVRAGGVALRVIPSPGHTPDHVVFFEDDQRWLFTGDAVLGRGTSVIDPPEGDLAEYLRSLERMVGLEPEVIYPGHGPVVRPAMPKLQEYLEHRRHREQQVVAALRSGPQSPADLVPKIYVGYPAELHAAAARSLLAHLLKLERDGVVIRMTGGSEVYALTAPGSRTGGQT